MNKLNNIMMIIVMLFAVLNVHTVSFAGAKTDTEKSESKILSININDGDISMVLIEISNLPSFWISRYEVTQKIYESVMGKNPSYFKGNNFPVEQVSWFNAVEFCNKLSLKTGYKPYYIIEKEKDDMEIRNSGVRWTVNTDTGADGFRLPTSAEWEAAARGNSKSKYFWGDAMNGEYCWYANNSHGTIHPVGTRNPNNYGIYDICGNVREWCFDRHQMYYGLCRVIRDGHYSLDEDEMVIGKVDYRPPYLEFGFIGIRLAKNK